MLIRKSTKHEIALGEDEKNFSPFEFAILKTSVYWDAASIVQYQSFK